MDNRFDSRTQISVATIHPTAACEALAGKVYGPGLRPSMVRMMDDIVAVNALAKVLDRGLEECTRKADGFLDTKDLAAFVLRFIRENG